MPYSLLPTLLLQILAIGYTPGPANIYSLAMSLRHGRRASLIMWAGLLTGFSIAVIIMAVLTHFIGMAFGEYVSYLKYLGAAYIVYLAYKIYKRTSAKETNKDCTFVSGMIVQMTNAKMLLFDLTVFSTFVLPSSDSLADLLEVGAWLVIAGPGANLVWILAGSYLKRFFAPSLFPEELRRTDVRNFVNYGRQVDIVSAIVLLLCAIYMII